ncbi:MAG: hypothetical protein E7812_06210 [Phenylobacterium sp.]|nr:MAG: hypothetical protein E7812_06210 [Phenylobacterium sp.]
MPRRRRPTVSALIALMLAAVAPARAEAPAAAPVGLQAEVTLPDSSELASNAELLTRFLNPLAAEAARRKLSRAGVTMAGQPVDPATARFTIYVPPTRPPSGYGLLVFVPPWREAALPAGWALALDRLGMIYVSAAASGNDQKLVTRRAPLALLAYQNMARRYPLDPARVYIGGFSGGSRVALRIALAYPDVFRGALLNAGSDPIGAPPIPLPAAALFRTFQARTRLFYVTGSADEVNLALDGASLASLHAWCVFHTEAKVMRSVGHTVPDAGALSVAIAALDRPAVADPGRLDACRSQKAGELDAALARVKALLAAGQRDSARKLLVAIDDSFGGLAAPATIELADQCDCGLLDPPGRR